MKTDLILERSIDDGNFGLDKIYYFNGVKYTPSIIGNYLRINFSDEIKVELTPKEMGKQFAFVKDDEGNHWKVIKKIVSKDEPNTQENKMSTEFIVGNQILESEHPQIFSEIVIMFCGKLEPNEVSKAMDRLNDLGFIKEDWINRNGNWRREIIFTKEGKEIFKKAMSLFRSINNGKNR